MEELPLPGHDGLLVLPDGEARSAVLVLGGSSGRVEGGRAHLLGRHGAAAAALRWFGGPGQPPGICEIPLETFTPALDRLAGRSAHLGVLGVSKGAEAALLLGTLDPRIRVVCALAPSSVVWAGLGEEQDGDSAASRSSWTSGGQPLPFVPYDPDWRPEGPGPPAFRDLYARSLDTFADRVPDATIEVERIAGDVVLAAGGDDRVWPSEEFADAIAARRAAHGLLTTVVKHPAAGHRLTLPGETPAAGGMAMDRGGAPEADAALGHRLWPILCGLLRLTGDGGGAQRISAE